MLVIKTVLASITAERFSVVCGKEKKTPVVDLKHETL